VTIVSLDDLCPSKHPRREATPQEDLELAGAVGAVNVLVRRGHRVVVVGARTSGEVAFLKQAWRAVAPRAVLIRDSEAGSGQADPVFDAVATRHDNPQAERVLQSLLWPPIGRLVFPRHGAHQPLFIGVDGGATATKAAVINDRGTVVGEGRYHGVHEYGYEAAVGAAVASALDGLDPRDVVRGVVGVAGHSGQAEAAIRAAWSELGLTAELACTNDVVIAPLAAGVRGEALVIICGTGSNVCVVRNALIVRRAGGYGAQFGETGSAEHLGRAAVTAVLQGEDGRGPSTSLKAAVQAFYPDVAWPAKAEALAFNRALVSRVLDQSQPALSRLAPAVVRAAEAGDTVAGTIIQTSTQALVRDAQVAVCDHAPSAIVLVGSLADPRLITGRTLREGLRVTWPQAQIAWVKSSEIGAAVMALGKMLAPPRFERSGNGGRAIDMAPESVGLERRSPGLWV
jgi:N-acetylglucosamine kinase-like BadF-type ATPase